MLVEGRKESDSSHAQEAETHNEVKWRRHERYGRDIRTYGYGVENILKRRAEKKKKKKRKKKRWPVHSTLGEILEGNTVSGKPELAAVAGVMLSIRLDSSD
ncbi:hypothetical protein Q7C36_022399 [Tachysurus vachellii]|uniref:Uncharacterized protein n=1 Tax=Tachysurus vachellii TaxID=175792 RepID=A0AA88INZ0_TACVA|nr:hypothetical protein Q7C36_022399 [Tachysurus vachellii]